MSCDRHVRPVRSDDVWFVPAAVQREMDQATADAMIDNKEQKAELSRN